MSIASQTIGSSPAADRVGRFRWWICLALFLVTVTNYMDRQAISIVAPVISAEFHFSNSEIAVIVNAFLVAYTVGQLFSGAFMDWIGSKLGLTLLVLMWSLASVLTALARGVFSFSLFRFLLGFSESGNFPGSIKVVSEWFPARERSTAVGLLVSGASVGALITPPLVAFLVVHFGWQLAFVTIGVPGFLWVMVWRAVYAPVASHPRLTAGERSYIEAGHVVMSKEPSTRLVWRPFIGRRMFWGVLLSRMIEEPAGWFYLTWLPIYLKGFRGASLMHIGLLLVIPFLTLDVGYMGGGWASSQLIKGGWSLDRARKSVMVCSALCMIAAIAAVRAPSTSGFVAFVSLATLGHGAWTSNVMTLPGDMVPHKLVGTLYGITACAGGLGSVLFMQVTGRLIDIQHSFNTVFVIAGILPVLASITLLTVTGRLGQMHLPGISERQQVPPIAAI